MFQPLPKETVFEAKQKSRRATFLLIVLVTLVYLAVFNAMAAAFVAFSEYSAQQNTYSGYDPSGFKIHDPATVFMWASVLAALAGWIHFVTAWFKPADSLLKKLKAVDADPKDEYHARFINIVHELEAATGLKGVRTVIVPDPGMNAFALEDSAGKRVIGVTEGLLAKLDRSELTAVISHEAAHLAHEDSKLVTAVFALTSVFVSLSFILSRMQYYRARPVRTRNGQGAAGVLLLQLVLLIISWIGQAITMVLVMAISRNREYLADAHGAHLCKDPLSLAKALEKISQGYRGAFTKEQGLASIFIMNPYQSLKDEAMGISSDLFSTHPPVKERVARLLSWAQTDAPKPDADKLYYRDEQTWKASPDPEQAVKEGRLKPQSFVLSGGAIRPAFEIPPLKALFDKRPSQTPQLQGNCPRCKTSLITGEYEGASVGKCRDCGGLLLKKGVLEKVISRTDKTFPPELVDQVGKHWILVQGRRLKELCQFDPIICPDCSKPMIKTFHSLHTRVVVDRCINTDCGSVWLDTGELEMIQIIVEHGGWPMPDKGVKR